MSEEYRLQIIIDVVNKALPEIRKTIEEAKKGLKELQEVSRKQEEAFFTAGKRAPSASKLKQAGLLSLREAEKEIKRLGTGDEFINYLKQLKRIRHEEVQKLVPKFRELYEKYSISQQPQRLSIDLAASVQEFGTIRGFIVEAEKEQERAVQELVEFVKQNKGQLSKLPSDLSKTFQGLKNRVKNATTYLKFLREANKVAEEAASKFEGFSISNEEVILESPEYWEYKEGLSFLARERLEALKQYREALKTRTVPQYIQDIQNTIQSVSETYQNVLKDFNELLGKPISEGGLAGEPQTEEEARQVFLKFDKFIGQIESLRSQIRRYLSSAYRGLIPPNLLNQLQNLSNYLTEQYRQFSSQYEAISEAYLGPRAIKAPPTEAVPAGEAQEKISAVEPPVEEAVQYLEKLVEANEQTQQIAETMSTVAQSTQEVAQASEQVAQTTSTVSSVTGETAKASQEVAQAMQETAKASEETRQATESIRQNLSHIERLAQIQAAYYEALKFGAKPEEIPQIISRQLNLAESEVRKGLTTLNIKGMLFGPLEGGLSAQLKELYRNIDITLSQLASGGNIDLAINNLRELGLRVEAFADIMAKDPDFTKRAASAVREYGTELYNVSNILKTLPQSQENFQRDIEDTKNRLLALQELLERKVAPKAIKSPFKEYVDQTRDLNYIFRNLTWIGFSLTYGFQGIARGLENTLRSIGEYALQTRWYSERFGMTTQDVQALKAALEYSNETIDHFATSLAVLSRKIYDAAQGSGVGVRALYDLGIQFIDSAGRMKPFQEILGQLFLRIKQLKDAGVEASLISAYLTKIFGRENTKLALFLAENIEDITERLEKAKVFGLVFSPQEQENAVKLMVAIKDIQNAWKGLSYQVFLGASKAILPVLVWIRDFIASLTKLSNTFKGVGGVIASVILSISKTLAVFGTMLLLVASIMRAFFMLKALGDVLKGLTSGVTIFGVSLGPTALAGAALLTVLTLLLPKILGISDAFREAQRGSSDFLKTFQETFEKFSELARDAGEEFMYAYAEGMKQGSWEARRIALQIAQDLFELFGGGHSPAKKGPLSNLEYWGLVFLEAYREGMTAGVQNLVNDVQNILTKINDLFYNMAYSLGVDVANLFTGRENVDFSKYYKLFLLTIKEALIQVTTQIKNTFITAFNAGIDNLNDTIQTKLGLKEPQSLVQQFGKGFFNTITEVLKNEVRQFHNTAFAPVIGFISTFFEKALSEDTIKSLTEWLKTQISVISMQRELISILSIAISQGHATGTITTKPHLALVGEEGPEAIIPLSPNRRRRAISLWIETGKKLGIVGYAEGGIVGGTVENLEDWVRALGQILIKAGDNFKTGIIAAIERWENAIRSLPSKLEIERKIEIPEIQKQTQTLDTIKLALIQGVKVISTIEKHLNTLNSTASTQVKIISKPSNVQRILELVETRDVNIEKWRNDFARALKEQVERHSGYAGAPIDINYSLLLQKPYMQFVPDLKKQLEEMRNTKLTLRDVINELRKIWDLWQKIEEANTKGGTSQNTFERFLTALETAKAYGVQIEKGAELKGAFSLMSAGWGKETEERFRTLMSSLGKALFQEEIVTEGGKKEVKRTPYEYGQSYIEIKKVLGTNLDTIAEAITGQKQLTKQVDEKILDGFNVLKAINETLNTSLKTTEAPKLSLTKQPVPEEIIKIPTEFYDAFVNIILSPLAEIKSGKGVISDLLKHFAEGSEDALNYVNLREEMKKTTQRLAEIEADFRSGKITTAKYIEEMKKLNQEIEQFRDKQGKAHKAISEYIKAAEDYRVLSTKLRASVTLLEGGVVPSNLSELIRSDIIPKETQERLENLLKEAQQSSEKEAVLGTLKTTLQSLANSIDSAAQIYQQGAETLSNGLDEFADSLYRTQEVADKLLLEGKNTIIDALGAWAQGDFTGAARNIIDYFRKAFYQGLVDLYLQKYGKQIENLAQSFSNVAMWLLKGGKGPFPKGEFNTMWANIKPMIDEGLLKPIGKFGEHILGIYQSQSFKDITDPQKWAETANVMGQTITKHIAGEDVAKLISPDNSFISKIGEWLGKIGETAKDIFSKIIGPEKIQGTVTGFKILFKLMQSGTDNIVSSVKTLLDPTKDLNEVSEQLSKTLGINAEEIKKFFSEKIIKIFPSIPGIGKEFSLEDIRKGLAGVFSGIKEIWTTFWEKTPIGQAASQIGGQLLGGLGDLLGGLIGGPIGSFIGDFLFQGLAGALSEFMGLFQDIYEGFLKDLIQLAKQVLKPIVIPVIQVIANLLKVFMDILKPFIPLFKVVAEIIGMMVTLWGKVFLAIWNTVLKPIIYAFIRALALVIKGIGYFLKPLDWLLGGVGQKLIDAANAMEKAADEMYESTGEAEPVEEQKKEDQPISIANLTGNALEGFRQLLAPLNSLNLLPSYFEQMLSYLREIRDALGGSYSTALAVSTGSTSQVTSPEITVNNLNIYVDQVADVDLNKIVEQVIYQVGVKAKNIIYAKGG